MSEAKKGKQLARTDTQAVQKGTHLKGTIYHCRNTPKRNSIGREIILHI